MYHHVWRNNFWHENYMKLYRIGNITLRWIQTIRIHILYVGTISRNWKSNDVKMLNICVLICVRSVVWWQATIHSKMRENPFHKCVYGAYIVVAHTELPKIFDNHMNIWLASKSFVFILVWFGWMLEFPLENLMCCIYYNGNGAYAKWWWEIL